MVTHANNHQEPPCPIPSRQVMITNDMPDTCIHIPRYMRHIPRYVHDRQPASATASPGLSRVLLSPTTTNDGTYKPSIKQQRLYRVMRITINRSGIPPAAAKPMPTLLHTADRLRSRLQPTLQPDTALLESGTGVPPSVSLTRDVMHLLPHVRFH